MRIEASFSFLHQRRIFYVSSLKEKTEQTTIHILCAYKYSLLKFLCCMFIIKYINCFYKNTKKIDYNI